MAALDPAAGRRPLPACALLAVLAFPACEAPDRQAPGRETVPAVSADSVPSVDVPESLRISEQGIGRFRLGSTLAEARREHPGATFGRGSDGDGAALVEVTLGGGESLTLYAGEDDAQAPIDWSRPIESIEVFRPPFSTGDGIRPGSRVTDVERAWGKVRRIVRSEIESREFIEFAHQPAGLRLRLDSSGRFPPGTRVTTGFEPSAAIHSIAVTRASAD